MPELVRVERYGVVAISLHWAIALLIVVNIPLGLFSEQIEDELGRSQMWLHKSLGLTVLLLSLVRLAWRLLHPPPSSPASISRWRLRIARATHVAFYALSIAVPLTGWLRSSATAYPLSWFGIGVPKFSVAAKSFEASLASISHEILAWGMLMLIPLHVGAALHHHFVLKDGLLLRMVPRRARRDAETGG